MNEKEKLQIYIKELEKLAIERIEDRNISAIDALREALNFVEGQFQGY